MLRERWCERFDALNANGLETCHALVHEDLERGEERVGKEGQSFWIFRERHEVKSGEKLAPFERWEDTLL